MQPEQEQIQKLSNRYFRLAVVCLFAMALLQGLHSFFLTLFFWPALGFVILAFYYQRIAIRVEQSNTAQWQQPDSSLSSRFNDKRITFLVVVSTVALLIIISSLISSKKNNSTNSEEIKKTDEPESQQEEKKYSEYDKALQEYNNQNYRQSISIARKALIADANNNDLMVVLGDDYGALKQNDSSFVWFDSAYQNGARSTYISHWLGYLYDEKGSASQAIEFYKDALKQDSTRTQIYDRLAELEPEKAEWYKKKSSQWGQKK